MNTWFLLALLFLACCYHDTFSCPALCKCYSKRAEVVCNKVPLTEFPSDDLPNNTAILTIQLTNITSISEQNLNATPLLQELHLYCNNISSLPSDLFRGVPLLHTVDLTGNKLRHLPQNVFSHAPLRSMVIKDNLISSVDAEWFPDNSNLTWLDLSRNQLTAVPTAMLHRLRQLESLDLSHNRLEKFPPNALETLRKLERLTLEGNKLSILDSSTFKNTNNLTHLFLLKNKLDKLPPTLFHELSNLRYLSLDDNLLRHIPPGLLDNLLSIDELGLDLSGNPLVCDGKVEYLWRWLQKNKEKVFLAENFHCASPEAFKERPVISLTESELGLLTSDCPHSNGALSCPDLCTCDFSTSETTVICNGASLSQFPTNGLPGNTTSLSIQLTNLSTITASHLSAVPLLKELRLYHTNLSSLPSDLLRGVPHLSMLDLTGNNLDNLPPNVFRHAGLRNLVIKKNLISSVDTEWFPHNSNLTSLDLSGNRLAAVPTALFQRLRHLVNLDLAHNRLEELLPSALDPLTSLEKFNLEGNKLSTLDPSTFTNTRNLTHLFLQENQLEKLPSALLQGLHHLQLLLLNHNQLSHLPSGLLDQLSSLEMSSQLEVVLGKNPWVCDGEVAHLWRWLIKNQRKVFFLKDVKCASPESLKDRVIVSLTEGELGLAN